MLAAEGVILGYALLAAAEHIGVLILDAGLDLDRGLLLGGVEQARRRRTGAKPSVSSKSASQRSLYFVASGRVAVKTEHAAEPLAEIGPGQPIGEIGFFSGIPRSATVRALRNSQVVEIRRAGVEHVTRTFPNLRDAVIRSLANSRSAAFAPLTIFAA